MRSLVVRSIVLVALLIPTGLVAQSFPTDNPIIKAIWDEGMNRSQVYDLSQTLNDSLGPRLTGSPNLAGAADWVIQSYEQWGIPARTEQYGTWPGWRRGTSHVDLIQPRVRSLNGVLLAWSPGTPDGRAVEAQVVTLPDFPNADAFTSWLPEVEGKFVAISFPQPTCRPDGAWQEYAGTDPMAQMRARFGGGGGTPATPYTRMRDARQAADSAWRARIAKTGLNARTLPAAIGEAGAAGILTSEWPNGYGATRIFQGRTNDAPTFSLSCEDYGLVARLAENNQGPVLRAQADAEFLGDYPAINTVGQITGNEKPDEYIVLSAHFDTWDGSSGATDNGTGTIIMMEAMRILKAVYANPKRTIVAGHWNSEEQGLNGSSAFATDHPEVIAGAQAVFNQDNGTGLISSLSTMGLLGQSEFLGRWVGQLPDNLTRNLRVQLTGSPSRGGSDHASFICHGAPAFGLGSDSWDYFSYTWHTDLDTFDKVVIENVRQNAVLTAMLAYLAAEDPETMPRDQRVLPPNRRTGEPGQWPTCRDGARTGPGGE